MTDIPREWTLMPPKSPTQTEIMASRCYVVTIQVSEVTDVLERKVFDVNSAVTKNVNLCAALAQALDYLELMARHAQYTEPPDTTNLNAPDREHWGQT